MPIEDIESAGADDVTGHAAETDLQGIPYFAAAEDRAFRRTYTVSGSEATSGSFSIYLAPFSAGAIVTNYAVAMTEMVASAGTATMTLGVVGAEAALRSSAIDITGASFVKAGNVDMRSRQTDTWLVARVTHTSGAWQAGASFTIVWGQRTPQLLSLRGGSGVSFPPFTVDTPLDTSAIPFPPPNVPPTLAITVPTTVAEGNSISLVATGVDPQGGALSYDWEIIGTQPPGVVIAAPNSASTFATTGNYTTGQVVQFRCTVTEDQGLQAIANATCIISATNAAPTVTASPPQMVEAGETVTLQASAIDPEGEQVTYVWSQVGGAPSVTLTSPNNPQGANTTGEATFTAPSLSESTLLRFSVTASDGEQTDSATSNVTVNAIPTMPADDLMAATGGTLSIEEGETATLNVTYTGGEGTPTYLWEQLSGTGVTLSSTTTQSVTFTAPAVDADENLMFRATVMRGSDSDSSDVEVTVVNTGTDLVHTQDGITITFDGTPQHKFYQDGSIAVLTGASIKTVSPTTVGDSWTPATNTGFSIASASGDTATFGSSTTDLTTILEDGSYFMATGFADTDSDGVYLCTAAPATSTVAVQLVGPWNAGAEPVDEAAGESVTISPIIANGAMVDPTPPYYGSDDIRSITASSAATTGTLDTADGSLTYSGTMTIPDSHTHLIPGNFELTWTEGGETVTVSDEGGFGEFPTTGRLTLGTIDYATGGWSLSFSTDPDNATDIDYSAYGYTPDAATDSATKFGNQGFSNNITRTRNADQLNYADAANDAIGIASGTPLTITTGQCFVASRTDFASGGTADAGATESNIAAVVGVHAVTAAQLAEINVSTFRPGICGDAGGSDRTHYQGSDVNYAALTTLSNTIGLPAVPATGLWSLGHTFIDLDPTVGGTQTIPSDYFGTLGAELMASHSGLATMTISTGVTENMRRMYLRQLIQVGIDIESLVDAGMLWTAEGAQSTGRKLPVVYKRFFLGDGAPAGGKYTPQGSDSLEVFADDTPTPNTRTRANDLPVVSVFGEDWQHDYVTSDGLDTQEQAAFSSAQVGMPEYGSVAGQESSFARFSGPTAWLSGQSAGNRQIATNAYGTFLAVYVLGMQTEWAYQTALDYWARHFRIADTPSFGGLHTPTTNPIGYGQYQFGAFWGNLSQITDNMFWGGQFTNKTLLAETYPDYWPTDIAPPTPAAPIANAGSPQSAAEGTVVTLDGSVSSSGADIVSYQWLQTGGPLVSLSDASLVSPTFTAPQVSADDSVTFQLTITDTFNRTDTDTVVVTVLDLPGGLPPGVFGTGSATGTSDLVDTKSGITWTVAGDPYRGKYSDGSWWVAGPVEITFISPWESIAGGTIDHGSMVNPGMSSSGQWGMTSRMGGTYNVFTYQSSLNVAEKAAINDTISINLSAGDSLVSCKSGALEGSNPSGDGQLEYTAVLTCVNFVEAGANGGYNTQSTATWLRPAPSGPNPGGNRTVYKLEDAIPELVDLDLPAGAPQPALKVRNDLLSGDGPFILFTNNRANYSNYAVIPIRQVPYAYGESMLPLCSNLALIANCTAYSTEDRHEALRRLLQIGIDIEKVFVDLDYITIQGGGHGWGQLPFAMLKRAYFGETPFDWASYDAAVWEALPENSGETAPNDHMNAVPTQILVKNGASVTYARGSELNYFGYVAASWNAADSAKFPAGSINAPYIINGKPMLHVDWQEREVRLGAAQFGPSVSYPGGSTVHPESNWDDAGAGDGWYIYHVAMLEGWYLILRAKGWEQYYYPNYTAPGDSIAAGGDGYWPALDAIDMWTRCMDSVASSGLQHWQYFNRMSPSNVVPKGNLNGFGTWLPDETQDFIHEMFYAHRSGGADAFWGDYDNKVALQTTYGAYIAERFRLAGPPPYFVNAGMSQTKAESSTVTLAATASETSTYAWVQTGGTSVTLSSDTAQSPTFTAPAWSSSPSDTLTFEVTGTDTATGAKTDTDTVTVTITEDQDPVLDMPSNQFATEATTVELAAMASDDGGGVTYAWTQLSGEDVTGGWSGNTTDTLSFTAPAWVDGGSNLLRFQLAVTDTLTGTQTTTGTVDVTVTELIESTFVWNGTTTSETYAAAQTVNSKDGFRFRTHHSDGSIPTEVGISITNTAQTDIENYEVLVYIDPESQDHMNSTSVWVCANDFDQTTIPDDFTGYSIELKRGNGGFNIDKDGSTVESTISSPSWDADGEPVYVRVKVESTSGQTIVRAKVWTVANSEPGSWEGVHTDTTSPYQSGGIGMYTDGSGVFGEKFVDFAVEVNNNATGYVDAGNSYS